MLLKICSFINALNGLWPIIFTYALTGLRLTICKIHRALPCVSAYALSGQIFKEYLTINLVFHINGKYFRRGDVYKTGGI